MDNRIVIIQGGQYGSEAKGAIAGYICRNEPIDVAVRTGATNAGHTVYYQPRMVIPFKSMDGAPDEHTIAYDSPVPVRMQQLPVGWVNPDIQLVLGAGSLIDPIILARECEEVSRLTGQDVKKRLTIDYRAGIHLPTHAQLSKESGRHHKIGATGKGCSEALIDRISGRGKGYTPFGASELSDGYNTEDTATLLNKLHNSGAKLMLEGTQGTFLDLYLGPYPFTTHKQCGPAQWMMEAGLSPALPTDIVLVCRTYPIRVAGNSGPLASEITWVQLARTINAKRVALGMGHLIPEAALDVFNGALMAAGERFHTPTWKVGQETAAQHQNMWTPQEREEYAEAISEINKVALEVMPADVISELCKLFEMTTVTKKLRRVANISWNEIRHSALLNRPHRIALTFMNYEFPQWWYEKPSELEDFAPMSYYVEQARRAAGGVPVTHMSFGPADEHVVDFSDATR